MSQEEETVSETRSALSLPAERVDPSTTRFLVIDVQNDFCAKGGWFDEYANDLTLIHRAVDRIVEFIEVARRAGVPPIFVRAIYDRIYLSAPMLERHARTGLGLDHCREGTWGADFFQVEPADGELVFTKHRYSAFKDTELNAYLRAQRVENLILSGITSNVCVESTARDAYMLDYHVVFLSDASATYEAEAHEATLANIRRAFGIVASTDDVIDAWRTTGALPASPSTSRARGD